MKGKVFGYARVSTRMQNLARQLEELEEICDEVFIDKASGKNANRPELKRMMTMLREGDQIKVLRLSRFGRSGRDLAELADQIMEAGATLHSLKEGFTLDGTSFGKMIYGVLAVLAEFEEMFC